MKHLFLCVCFTVCKSLRWTHEGAISMRTGGSSVELSEKLKQVMNGCCCEPSN